MRVLNVAEKPAMARQIASLLSSNSFTSSNGKNKFCKNYEFSYNLNGRSCNMIMTSVLGHVKELDFSSEYTNWILTPPDSLFEAEILTKVAEDKKGIVQNLQIQGRLAQMLVIWTDCDREGEHIGSEIVEICRSVNPRLDVYRARYSAVTQNELRRSMNNLQLLDQRQVAAVEARTELDLRSGAIFTRFQTLRLRDEFPIINKEIISYGPCQFPTLGFVVEQYMKVHRFKPEPFWHLELVLEKDSTVNKFTWKRGHLFDQLITLILYERSIEISGGFAKIIGVEERPTSKYRPLPLRTVEFQKAASRFLKISSDQVMNLAEKLYNRGYISYPRTETDVFEFSVEQLKSLVQKQSGDRVFGEYARDLLIDSGGFRIPRKGKNNDKAHPPIHPTASGEDLSGQERSVFEFVARRFLACCSDDAKGQETKISAKIGVEEFECKGIRVTELNYLLVYKYEKWTEQEIGPFRSGETVPIKEYLMKEGSTSAPLLLSESDLITCMDKNGIGTDATIHEHIHKIITRRYALKGPDSRFIPTRLGVALVEAFDQLGLDLSLTQPKIRSKLERDLSLICEGRLSKERVIQESKEMYKLVYRRVEAEFERLLRVFRKYLGAGTNRHSNNNNTNNDSNNNNNDDDDFPNLPPGSPFDSMPRPPGNSNNSHYNNNRNEDYDQENDGDYGNDSNKSGPKKRNSTRKPSTGVNKRAKKSNDSYKDDSPADRNRNESTVFCMCSIEAVKRTVSKDGPNKGKQFWGCSKDFSAPDNCKFFEWVDESKGKTANKTNRSSATSISKTRQQNSYKFDNDDDDDDGEMRCKCGLIMKQEVMKSGKDAGRSFVKCPKIVQRCGMFQFLDGKKGTFDVEGRNGTRKQKCFKCNKVGHWANSCPGN